MSANCFSTPTGALDPQTSWAIASPNENSWRSKCSLLMIQISVQRWKVNIIRPRRACRIVCITESHRRFESGGCSSYYNCTYKRRWTFGVKVQRSRSKDDTWLKRWWLVTRSSRENLKVRIGRKCFPENCNWKVRRSQKKSDTKCTVIWEEMPSGTSPARTCLKWDNTKSWLQSQSRGELEIIVRVISLPPVRLENTWKYEYSRFMHIHATVVRCLAKASSL